MSGDGPAPDLSAAQLAALLDPVVELVREAAAAVMEVYADEAGFAVETKADDSPLTAADRRAHEILAAGLRRIAPEIALVSEEDEAPTPVAEIARLRRFWLVDPLDGTKEFVKRNGEFTVNVALVESGAPVLGAVWAPAQDRGWAGYGDTAWALAADGGRAPIRAIRLAPGRPLRVAASRSHPSPGLERLMERLHGWHPGGVETLACGSSLKICAVADGRADLYPRLGPTSEWDTAAADAVLRAAGGGMAALPGLRPLAYGKPEGILNPSFAAWGDGSQDWAALLEGLSEG